MDKWYNCYDASWKGIIVPEAFTHPAKFARGLIRRIYQHAKEMGWVKPGDWVLDPFGGVALGGLDAMSMGLYWIGCELEAKFVSLGEQNIALWQKQLEGWPNLGTARIVQGDSRNLRNVLEQANIVVSSPPYTSDGLGHRGGYSDVDLKKKLYAKISGGQYGQSPGQLANMKEGNFDLCVSSPPYSGIASGAGGLNTKPPKHSGQQSGRNPMSFSQDTNQHYGEEEGQLARMNEGSIDAIISSPPFETSDSRGGTKMPDGYFEKVGGIRTQDDYHSTDKANLANSSGDTFWSASKIIVQQCYDLLKPGGHAIWVCKDYIKNKKRVPFSDNWQKLCESVGFKLVCRHQAMLVTTYGKQMMINGGEEEISIERKSFFRRLAESKGSPRIDHEDVICLRKD